MLGLFKKYLAIFDQKLRSCVQHITSKVKCSSGFFQAYLALPVKAKQWIKTRGFKGQPWFLMIWQKMKHFVINLMLKINTFFLLYAAIAIVVILGIYFYVGQRNWLVWHLAEQKALQKSAMGKNGDLQELEGRLESYMTVTANQLMDLQREISQLSDQQKKIIKQKDELNKETLPLDAIPLKKDLQRLDKIVKQHSKSIVQVTNSVQEMESRVQTLEHQDVQEAERRVIAKAAIKEEVVTQLKILKGSAEKDHRQQQRQSLYEKYMGGKPSTK